MSAPIPLRLDFDASQLRGLARKTKDGPQARRLLALAAIYDGAMRTDAAKIGGVGVQIIRDWVLRFNTRGPDGLLDGKSPGHPPKLNDAQRQAIARMLIDRGLKNGFGVMADDLMASAYAIAVVGIAQALFDQGGNWLLRFG